MSTPRQIFANWRKSRNGFEVIRDLLRKQLWMCPSCYTSIAWGQFHVHHTKPISKLTEEELKLITDESNLVLLCPKCNLKQSSKLDTRFD